MFGISMPELIIIMVIALIVIGPKKLPDLAKALGRGMAEFRKATQEIKESFDLEEEFKEAKEDLVDSVSGLNPPEEPGADLPAEETPKYEDYDQMLEDYQLKKAAPGESPKGEKAEEDVAEEKEPDAR
jgi:TatA/E family protein of Tat protein translocase